MSIIVSEIVTKAESPSGALMTCSFVLRRSRRITRDLRRSPCVAIRLDLADWMQRKRNFTKKLKVFVDLGVQKLVCLARLIDCFQISWRCPVSKRLMASNDWSDDNQNHSYLSRILSADQKKQGEWADIEGGGNFIDEAKPPFCSSYYWIVDI